MQKLQQLASALSSSGGTNGGGGGPDTPPASSAQNGQGNQMPDLSGLMSMKIQPALSAYNQDDKNTVLLKSLKPHLRPERQNRVDEALKLMKLASLLPMFVQSGLFGSGGER